MPSTAKKNGKEINPVWKRWDTSMKKMVSTKLDIENNPSPHGKRWTHSMILHWKKQIKLWEELEPEKHL